MTPQGRASCREPGFADFRPCFKHEQATTRTPAHGERITPEIGDAKHNATDTNGSSSKFSSQADVASIRAGILCTTPYVPTEQLPSEDSTDEGK